jgi:hypothetical protein
MVALLRSNGWDRRLAEDRAETRARAVIDARPDLFNEAEAVEVVAYARIGRCCGFGYLCKLVPSANVF